MILVTVGTQLPFDRLIKELDSISIQKGLDIVAQIGPQAYSPKNFQSYDFLEPQHLEELIVEAEFIISHAGMGSILTALTMGKTILIMPRLASRGEHRNDHQLATAKKFENYDSIVVAYNETELMRKIDEAMLVSGNHKLSSCANATTIEAIKNLINS